MRQPRLAHDADRGRDRVVHRGVCGPGAVGVAGVPLGATEKAMSMVTSGSGAGDGRGRERRGPPREARDPHDRPHEQDGDEDVARGQQGGGERLRGEQLAVQSADRPPA